MRPLDALLSRPVQQLIAAVMVHPEKDFGTLELLARMGSSRGAGSTILKRWVAAGVLIERRLGNQRRLAANPNFLLYPELRRIALKTIGCVEPLAAALKPVRDYLSNAFVFGSVAAGTDSSESDIDVVLVGNIDLFSISPLIDAAERELGRSVHLNLYEDKEWSSTDDPVLSAIKAGPQMDLMEALREQTR